MNLTIFSIPKSFEGSCRIRQENAIQSWCRLEPRPSVILFCDDLGVEETAAKLGCVYEPDIERDEKHGNVPIIRDAFRRAAATSEELLCYTNADIILFQKFVSTLKTIAAKFEKFLMIGQYIDLSIPDLLDFSEGWQSRLQSLAKTDGHRTIPCGSDFFAYRKGTLDGLVWPPFLVGNPAWDDWLVNRVKQRGIPIVDITEDVLCIHQHHDRAWPFTKYNRTLWREEGSPAGCAASAGWVVRQGKMERK